MKRIIAVIALAALVTSCQTQPPPPLSSKFSQAEAAFALKSGTARIQGQAFMRQRGGGVVTAAGSDVILIPDQPYTREMINRDISGQGFLTAEYQPVFPYSKTTVADASGSFAFTNLAAGNYIVITEVKWLVPTQYGGMNQGGTLASPVTVRSGETAQIILR